MDIKTVMERTFTITLTEQEARTALDDPFDLQSQLQAILDGAPDGEPDRRNGRKRKSSPKGRMGTGQVSMTTCPLCNKQFKRIKVHMVQSHKGQTVAPAAGDSSTPAIP